MTESFNRLNFLLTTWEGGGTVGPFLTVARKLHDAGHRVRIMSDACNRPEAEKLGLRFIPWTRAPSRPDRSRESEIIRDWAADNPLEGFRQALNDLFAGPALGYAHDVLEELQREPADLVVTSDFLFGVMAGCESVGQPCVAFAGNSIVFPVDNPPIAGPGHGRILSREEAEQGEVMRNAAREAFDSGLPALNAARASLGLRPLRGLLDQLSYVGATLVAISKYFDMAHEPVPPEFRYIGPQLDEVAWVEDECAPSRKRARPMVLVSFSTTFQNHIACLQRVIDGLAKLPVEVVVTLGPTIEPHELRPARNCTLFASVPHGALMREASLVVTHGGHGTVARALSHDLPMLVIPHGRDQDGNAARVEAHGAGITLPPSATTATIEESVTRLLSDSAFAAAAARLGEQVRREAEACDVVAELECLCRRAVMSMAS